MSKSGSLNSSFSSRKRESESEHEALLSGDDVSVGIIRTKNRRVKLFLAMLALFSATGGFLFGYDTGVVSGAMLKVDKKFSLSPLWHEVIVSATIGAAALAACLAGPMTEVLGRRPVLMIASMVFTVGAVVMGVAPSKVVLLLGRLIVGLGIGLAAMAVPMYIAESAPSEMRGKLVVLNNLFITGGQFVAAIIDGGFSYVQDGWRYMLGLAGIPSVIMLVGFCFLPESPRWLVFHQKEEKARLVLRKLRAPERVERELKEIKEDYEEYLKYKLDFLTLVKRFFTTRTVLLALLVGCGLQMFQQLSGINTVMYYSASIIAMAGFDTSSSIWLASVTAFGNFIFTIVGLLLVDRIGRRKLLIGSLVGVVFGFLLLTGSFTLMNKESMAVTPLNSTICNYDNCGACVGNSHCSFCAFHSNSTDYEFGTCEQGDDTGSKYHYGNDTKQCYLMNNGSLQNDTNLDSSGDIYFAYNNCPNNRWAFLTIIALFIYIMFFAPGMGPLPWTINAEIYPTWARSMAIAIATSTNWIFNLFVSLTFLTLADEFGQPWTFTFYAILSFLGLLFVIFLVPETKGRSLEEVEDLFHYPYFMSWCRRKKDFATSSCCKKRTHIN